MILSTLSILMLIAILVPHAIRLSVFGTSAVHVMDCNTLWRCVPACSCLQPGMGCTAEFVLSWNRVVDVQIAFVNDSCLSSCETGSE